MAKQHEDGSICYTPDEQRYQVAQGIFQFLEWMDQEGFRFYTKGRTHELYFPAIEDVYGFIGYDPVDARRITRERYLRVGTEGTGDGNETS